MATANDVMTKGYNAAAALTKYRAVKFSAAETVTPVTAITDVVCGIVQNTLASGDITNRGMGAQVRVMGASLVEAASAITIGVLVSINTSGQAKAAATGERVIGMCVEAASGAGKYARVQLVVPGPLAP